MFDLAITLSKRSTRPIADLHRTLDPAGRSSERSGFSRFLARSLSFHAPRTPELFSGSEALPLSDLIGIRDVNEVAVQSVIPDRSSGKVLVLSHESDFTSFP